MLKLNARQKILRSFKYSTVLQPVIGENQQIFTSQIISFFQVSFIKSKMSDRNEGIVSIIRIYTESHSLKYRFIYGKIHNNLSVIPPWN